MNEEKRPQTRESVDREDLWRAALLSRREAAPDIVYVIQTWSRPRLVALVGLSTLAGILIGVGSTLTVYATEPTPPAPTSLVALREMPSSPPPTLTPSPTPSPNPTRTPSPTASLTPTLSPSLTPTSTLAPTPAAMAVIKARVLNVRAGPGVDYDIVGYAARQQRYRIVEQSSDGGWLRIDFDGLVGWISARWAKVVY